MNPKKIILPGQIPVQPNKPPGEVQIPIFPIPVESRESFLLYSLCLYAVEARLYQEMPEAASLLLAMRSGLEKAYQRLGVPLYQYRMFYINLEDENVTKEGEQDECLEQSEKSADAE